MIKVWSSDYLKKMKLCTKVIYNYPLLIFSPHDPIFEKKFPNVFLSGYINKLDIDFHSLYKEI